MARTNPGNPGGKVNQAGDTPSKGRLTEGHDDEGANKVKCPICMQPWTSGGERQVSSLKCGHFFCHRCILLNFMNSNNFCAICKRPAEALDIRKHYVSHLEVLKTDMAENIFSGLQRILDDYQELKETLRTKCSQLEEQGGRVGHLEKEREGLRTKLREQTEKLEEQLGQMEVMADHKEHLEDVLMEMERKKDEREMELTMENEELKEKLTALDRKSLEKKRKIEDFEKEVKRLKVAKLLTNGQAAKLQSYSWTKLGEGEGQHVCKVMAYSEVLETLIVAEQHLSPKSDTFGVRAIDTSHNAKDEGKFVGLHMKPVTDLKFHPRKHHLLLSTSKDKTVKIFDARSEIVVDIFRLDEEACSCSWHPDSDDVFFVGTNLGKLMTFDMKRRSHVQQITSLPQDGKFSPPIIALETVNFKSISGNSTSTGLFVLTLKKLLYSDFKQADGTLSSPPQAIDLTNGGIFRSMSFDRESQMTLVSIRPTPTSSRLVTFEMAIDSEGGGGANANGKVKHKIFFQKEGEEDSFHGSSRATLASHPADENRKLIAYAAGPDNKNVNICEIGSEVSLTLQDLCVQDSVVSIVAITLQGVPGLAVLCKTGVALFKWI